MPLNDRALRIGVLVASNGSYANWELRLLDLIASDRRFVLAARIIHPDPFAGTCEPGLFTLYSKLEKRLFARERAYRPRKFDPSQMSDLVSLTDEAGHAKNDADIADLVGDLALDLVIRLTPNGLPLPALEKLTYGEWACSFTDNRSQNADWSGYASVIADRPSAELDLCVRGPDGRKRLLVRTGFNIKFSAERNGAFVKERAVTLLRRELGRLADERAMHPGTIVTTTSEAPPGFPALIWYSGKLAHQLTLRAIKAFKAKTGIGSTVWTLYSGQGGIGNFNPSSASELPPTRSEIRADPFLLDHEGQTYIFYEAYAAGARKAHIAVGRLDNGKLVPLGPALERDHHLSYPFVFHHDGELFMMPETNQARRIEVWRCVEFPHKWELYSTALEGQSPADSLLVQRNGEWWLFTNLSDFHAHEDHCSELYVFKVDGPALKNVVPHRHNPVVLDGTVARNAGRMFEIGGRLYRPSQRNEYGMYGYGLNIMEIEALDLDRYQEKCIRVIRPNFKPGLLGCHHFDASGDRFVIDARLSN